MARCGLDTLLPHMPVSTAHSHVSAANFELRLLMGHVAHHALNGPPSAGRISLNKVLSI
jgi:hypothetical protein